MRSFFFYILLFLTAPLLFGQLTLKPISRAKSKTPKGVVEADIREAALPFWDDFSISDQSPDSLRIWGTDTILQWDPVLSRGVLINSTMAISEPTYKVATFDGLDSNGDFYVPDDDAVGLADQLVSFPLDLGGRTVGDSIYLSFFWQAGGNVERPEEGDSLVLQLLDTAAVWQTVWMVEGSEELEEDQFTQAFFLLTDGFLGDSLRFQFLSYGDLDGPFDAWHIDWVYLNNKRTIAERDNGYLDGAFTGEISSPFAPFYSMPISQFGGNTDFIRNQTIGIRSLNLLPGDPGAYPADITYSLVNTNSNTLIVEDSERAYAIFSVNRRLDTLATLMLADVLNPAGLIFLNEQDFSSLLPFDSVVLRTEISLVANDTIFEELVDLRVNDTIRTDYTLHDYYAFDDGTAEYAAGINIRNGQVAVQYWLQQSDTLTHIDINFPNISPIPQSSPTLTLKILGDLEDDLLLRSQQITVENNESRNSFTRYELNRPLIVSDTFYIAYQQFINDYIGIGFDRSNPEASPYIFENKDGDWIQNVSLNGALMIRPVFQNGIELTLGVESRESVPIYPNPTKGSFSIGGEYEKIQLLDLSGRVLLEESSTKTHDVSKFEQGLYLLKIFQNNTPNVQKIILK